MEESTGGEREGGTETKGEEEVEGKEREREVIVWCLHKLLSLLWMVLTKVSTILFSCHTRMAQ